MMNTMKILILILFTSQIAIAAKIGEDDLKVAKPGSTSNKTLKLGNTREIRSNETSGKLEFTNDGTNYKGIGSGSGGASGVNFLQDLNGDFEAGAVNWTNSGGTFIATSTTPISGAQSGLFTASATGQFVESSLIVKTLGAGGRTCSATFDYNWAGVAGQLQAAVYNQTNALVAGPIDLVVTTSTQTLPAQLPMFDCDIATQYKVRVTSTAASAAIKIDDAFIGYGKNSLQVSQAEIFGQSTMFPTAGAALWTGGSFANLVYGSTISATYSGKISAGSGNNLEISMPNMPAGKYEITVNMSMGLQNPSGSGANQCQVRIYDGLSEGDHLQMPAYSIRDVTDANSNGDDENSVRAVYSFATAQTNKTFRLQGLRTGGAAFTCFVGTANWVVKYYPLNANNAITLETSGWKVDVNIGASSGQTSLGIVNVATYTGIEASNLDMVVNPGSLQAKIPCSGTNPATGLTCAAGNESVGVQFDAPSAGVAQVCMSFGHVGNIASGAQLSTGFTVVKTGNADQTISSTNNQRLSSDIASVGIVAGFPHQNCGFIDLTAGTNTLRLFYEQFVTGTVTSSSIITDRATTAGQRDVHITVLPVGNQFPTPVFTDLQNSLRNRAANSDSGQSVIYSARINNNGSVCAVDASIIFGGSWINSVSRPGTGNCVITFASGFFNGSTAPVCTALSDSTVNNNNEIRMNGITATTVNMITATAAGATTDQSFNLMCMGRK